MLVQLVSITCRRPIKFVVILVRGANEFARIVSHFSSRFGMAAAVVIVTNNNCRCTAAVVVVWLTFINLECWRFVHGAFMVKWWIDCVCACIVRCTRMSSVGKRSNTISQHVNCVRGATEAFYAHQWQPVSGSHQRHTLSFIIIIIIGVERVNEMDGRGEKKEKETIKKKNRRRNQNAPQREESQRK